MRGDMKHNRQTGAVSIFVVIFAALLLIIVTVGFIQIMIADQREATNRDLSQSAYDSALAGVEDSKRALLRYLSICETGSAAACSAARTAINSDVCNEAVRAGNIIGSDSEGPRTTSGTYGEIKIQQSTSTGDGSLDQAYTCVKMELDTDDFVGNTAMNQSVLVPLRGTGDIDAVTVEWFSRDDLSGAASTAVSLLGATAAPKPLIAQANWPGNRPPLLRTQLMQFGNSFTLDGFDVMPSGRSNTNTVFLYPTSDGAANTSTSFAARDVRKSTATDPTLPATSADTPLPVRCSNNLSSGGYSCRLRLALPDPIGGGDRTAYLRLTPLYNSTHFRITMSRGPQAVQFSGVQPIVDSTGRANDLFRRVESRVNLVDTSFPYPEAAIDLTGDLCKDFAVTDTTYYASSSCTP